jgi:hypothetical protein
MGLALIGMALGLAVVGCGKDEGSSSNSSPASSSATTSASSAATGTSAAAAPAAGDLTTLLMKPESIPPTPAGPWVGDAPQTDPAPPPSVKQFYKSGSNNISSTVILAPDAAAAANSVQNTITGPDMAAQIKGTPAPAPNNVAKNAMVINGTSADGSASMSILMFSEGKAIAQITFIGPLGDAVTPDYLDTVGAIQLDAIQQNLPKLGG